MNHDIIIIMVKRIFIKPNNKLLPSCIVVINFLKLFNIELKVFTCVTFSIPNRHDDQVHLRCN